MSKKKIISLVAVPIGITAVISGLYFTAGKSVWNLVVSDYKTAVIKGAPEYSYENVAANDVAASNEETTNGEIDYPLTGAMFGEISCDKINLKAPMYYGDTEEILEKGTGMYAGSSLPGQNGTILIGGHDTTFMAPLEQVAVGDTLTAKTTYGTYTYEVTEMKVADLLDQSAYDLYGTSEQLVLYTCYPFGEITGDRSKRYFVYAKKVSDPVQQEVK
ncbi:MAG: class D sortase [bacterium]|nr:class D sortase [bacterium]